MNAPEPIKTSHVMNTYGRLPVTFARGEGVWLWDEQGRKYLDGLAGIAVNGLGHAHPKLVKALTEQIATLIHTSNVYGVRGQEDLADMICARSGMEEVFFCNSGAEANENAIKLARFHGYKHGRNFIKTVVMEQSWHGRTIATLAATGSEKARKGFEPMQDECFVRVPYNNLAAIVEVAETNPEINSVLLEVLQGEGGINVADAEYLQGLRKLCDERGWLLILDEVQCGVGRTGVWFGYQNAGIEPDAITLAKGLGSGVPIGALAVRGPAAKLFGPGNLGTTFGGNPLAMRAGVCTLQTIEEDGLMAHAKALGDHIRAGFAQALAGVAGVNDIRGLGLMIGIELDRPCGAIVTRALEAGLLVNVTRDQVVRLLPPLVMTTAEADLLIAGLAPIIKNFLLE
ncbi:aspartate aminotransferase family protein [Derxia lacustris]|uniref:aspartate aminotransferase family protein n=1 Tax=Derxia lacustris TaxID=764842 RepID=UPI000A16D2A9|nr:aspartate aminotransferase family protein [Derxia lacustris]